MSAATLPPPVRATIDDLMRFDGKAELINGRIVPIMDPGHSHNLDALAITFSLHEYSKRVRRGTAYGDSVAYSVPDLKPRRESFSPDSSWNDAILDRRHTGAVPGAPTFAVEVRSPEDYDPVAEKRMHLKRDEYFEAGTLAVWDVNSKTMIVALHLTNGTSQTFRRGEIAHAEPAVPGWTMPVDDIFT